MTALVTKVKGLREAKQLSLTQLADGVPMHKSYLSVIEGGKDANLGRKILQGLANALDVRIDYLIDNSTDEARSWEKVAADESLELFLKTINMSEEEKNSLRRVSFIEGAPRTLKGWEELWNSLKVYSQHEANQPII